MDRRLGSIARLLQTVDFGAQIAARNETRAPRAEPHMFRERNLTFRLAALYAMVFAVLWVISRLTVHQMFKEFDNEFYQRSWREQKTLLAYRAAIAWFAWCWRK
jgi:hypothetical protein